MPDLFIAPSWSDQRWQKAVQKLTSLQKLALENSLRELLTALKGCRHPMVDEVFKKWRPSRWDVPRIQATQGEWIEYRLGDDDNRGRVIICFDRKDNAIYLVARTPIHDHSSLRELVAKFSSKRPRST